MTRPQTREEFVAGYCERSRISKEFYDHHFVALPCDCGADKCKGWATVRNTPEMVELHNSLYAPRSAT